MSHIVQIQTQIRDPLAMRAACSRLKLPEPIFGEARLYSGVKTGWQVCLPRWRYPVVCDVRTGALDYDNFKGRWGEPVELDRFLQTYAVERAKAVSRQQGYTSTEQTLPDGSIKLTVQVEGAVS